MTTQAAARVISDREFVLEHTFRASAAKVFAAYTDPKQVPHWWGPKGTAVHVDAMDVRPGGTWRYVQRPPNAPEMAFSGKYLEVDPVHRLVYTYTMEAQPANVITVTIDLKETSGATLLTMTSLCVSKEVRDTMLSYGAAKGAKMVWDRLAEFIGGA